MIEPFYRSSLRVLETALANNHNPGIVDHLV
jgi:hypothetical protein